MKVGVLGGGQLGQMLALAGIPLGIDVTCFDPAPDACARRAGSLMTGEWDDIYRLREWAQSLDALTYEFENIPVELVSDLSEHVPVHPGVNALATAQDRWAEKRLFNELDIPVPPFRTATTRDEVEAAIHELDYPVVVKTRTGGYDGKGQAVLRGPDDLEAVDALLESHDVIVEQLVTFQREVSVLVVRSRNAVASYPLSTNEHRDGILRTSVADDSAENRRLHTAAAEYAERIAKHLNYTGVLALELFVVDGGLLANEMAPRVHNSGHWTIEGAETSQFENHLRAVTGLPLGSTALRGAAAMVNFIGTVPATADVLAVPGAALHRYGKDDRPGRKVGHATVTAPTRGALEPRLAALTALT